MFEKFGNGFGCVMKNDGYLQPHSGPFAVLSSPYEFSKGKDDGKLQSKTVAAKADWTKIKGLRMCYDPNQESFMDLYVKLSSIKWAKEADNWAWVPPWLAAFWRCGASLGRIVIIMKMPTVGSPKSKLVLGGGQLMEFTVINYFLKRQWIGANTDGRVQGDIYRVISLTTGEDDAYFAVDPSSDKKTLAQVIVIESHVPSEPSHTHRPSCSLAHRTGARPVWA
jgi:hypothetical protein